MPPQAIQEQLNDSIFNDSNSTNEDSLPIWAASEISPFLSSTAAIDYEEDWEMPFGPTPPCLAELNVSPDFLPCLTDSQIMDEINQLISESSNFDYEHFKVIQTIFCIFIF